MNKLPGLRQCGRVGARRQTRDAGRADPVAQYLTALNEGDTHGLETVWPGEVVVHDPRAGEIRGHRKLRRFVSENGSWLAERHARIETVASTCVGGRAVVELLARLADDGEELAWPVAVVAESPDEWSVVFRTYCSQWPVDRRRHIRPPILKPGHAHPGDVVGRYQAALDAGDAKRQSVPSPRTGTSASRSARRTPTAAPMSSGRSSPQASKPAAASASSTAP